MYVCNGMYSFIRREAHMNRSKINKKQTDRQTDKQTDINVIIHVWNSLP